MAVFRITHNDFEKINSAYNPDTLDLSEWDNTMRLNESGWESRYVYEAEIIKLIIEKNNFKNILEIGSGPGRLSQIIQEKITDLNYHLIDKPFAKKFFEENNYKGTFFVKDISLDIDKTGLLEQYDLIICNDVIEHVLCPTNLLKRINELLSDNGRFFISVPNWRMAHQMIYRGLFDYDNFLYLMYIHKFNLLNCFTSPLVTPDYPRIDSEESMPEEMRRSWNWYFESEKR